MQLTAKTLRVLAELINGERPTGESVVLTPYRTLGAITEFFRDFGERDIHPRSGGPSRHTYTSAKLDRFNATAEMPQIICRALDFWLDYPKLDPRHAAAHLNKFLRRDGHEVIVEERYLRMNGDHAETEPFFVVRPLASKTVEPQRLVCPVGGVACRAYR